MKQLLSTLLLVAMLLQSAPVQAQEYNIWLPIVSDQEALNTPVGGCVFNTEETGDGDYYVYIVATETRSNKLVTYWNESNGHYRIEMPFTVGETRYMTRFSRITNDQVYAGVEAANGDFQAHCVMIVNPNVAAAAAVPNPVADPPAVPEDFQLVWLPYSEK
jgi:hypothetical protein